MSLSIQQILEATVSEAKRLLQRHKYTDGEHALHLDIGPGHGNLIKLLRKEGSFITSACDYTADLMTLDDVKVDIVDLNTQKLPYQDNAFDLVTCTEVIEHIEHYREALREMHRVLKPSGVLVVTTPNILNIKSRLRFLFFGFYNLFGPLHTKESCIYSTGGHINPVSFLPCSRTDGCRILQRQPHRRQIPAEFIYIFHTISSAHQAQFAFKHQKGTHQIRHH